MVASVAVSLPSDAAEFPAGDNIQYEKILNLRDEVFSGTHPRLKLATAAASKVASNSVAVQSQAVAGPHATNGVTPVLKSSNAKESTHPGLTPLPITTINALSPKPSWKAADVKRGTSGFDPILLTKSDDLIREEMKLERQRLERSLEEQAQQKRLGARERFSDIEALPDFDVSEVLNRARELVKPLESSDKNVANGIASSSDSLDDNTFYSSQVNDSSDPDDHTSGRTTKPCKHFFEGTCKKGDACTFSHDPAYRQKLRVGRPLTVDLDNPKQIKDTTAGSMKTKQELRTERFVKYLARTHNGVLPEHVKRASPVRVYDLRSRNHVLQAGLGDGSDELPTLVSESQEFNLNNRAWRNQPTDLQLERNQSRAQVDSPIRRVDSNSFPVRGSRVSPSVRDVRVVRNHITSPAAPQPARVSPLAVAKLPRLDQVRRGEVGIDSPMSIIQTGSTLASPIDAAQTVRSRKRRREADDREISRNVVPRRDLESPGVYIKEEPLSPPPISDMPLRRYTQPEHRNQMMVDRTTPPYREQVVYQRRYPEPIHMEMADVHRVSTPVIRRVVSRAGQHYEVREEPELRRVVNVRQPQRLASPSPNLGHYPAPQTRPARAMSHAVIVQPDPSQPPNYRASGQPQQPVIYDPYDRSLSPEVRRIRYSPVEPEIISMAPPPRRVVMDQYGNKYYEAERKSAAAPAPVTRYVEQVAHPYPPSLPRSTSVRPQLTQTYDDGGYGSRLEFSGPTSPHFVEYYPAPEPLRAVSRQRVYEPRAELHGDRNSIVRVVEYPPPRMTSSHYEEVVRPSEEVSRLPDHRSGGVQYEMARDRLPRLPSVRPEPERMMSVSGRGELGAASVRSVRAETVRAEDRYEHAPAYVSAERPRHQYVSDRRETDGYLNGEVRDEVLVETLRDGRRRRG